MLFQSELINEFNSDFNILLFLNGLLLYNIYVYKYHFFLIPYLVELFIVINPVELKKTRFPFEKTAGKAGDLVIVLKMVSKSAVINSYFYLIAIS